MPEPVALSLEQAMDLLTPQMRQLVTRIERAKRPPLHTLPAAQARAAHDLTAGLLDVTPPALPRIESLQVPTRDGATIAARLYSTQARDTGSPLPALLFFHGGGFTVGNLATHDVLCRMLASLSACVVVSLDYRLAPEHRFPTAVHDSWDALAWLVDQGESLGLDVSRLAVGGDSAGGTLAAVAALHARDIGLPLKLQLLFYPGTTAHQDTPSHQRFAHGPILTAPLIRWFFQQYIDDADQDDWRFAPLLADDHEGVAPAWIGLAEVDPLIDEGLAYADKLRMAHVPVKLEIYRGVTHGMLTMSRAIPEARQAQRDAANALRLAMGLPE